jgi:hypothetical protein
MDERVRDCGSCVNKVSEFSLLPFECQPYSKTNKNTRGKPL